MNNYRAIIIQVLVILIVSTLIAVLFLPLANTNWAEGMRIGSGSEDGKIETDMPAVFGWIMSFVKIGIFMVIPGLITLGFRRIVKGKPRSKSTLPA